ncbi:MAG: class I SAM-dependent methyltransferase [Polyangiaceae bacterium]|nr:class I SAM-dependent methyltransferase [Polyangiaceae bacterium]
MRPHRGFPPRRSIFVFFPIIAFVGPVAGACQNAGSGTRSSVDAPLADCRQTIRHPDYPDNPASPPEATFGPGYEFSEDWFTRNVPVWNEHLAPFRERPNLRYLEVGTFEGMSAIWMLKHVLTADSALAEGVDPYFDEAYLSRARRNLEHSGQGGRFKLHCGLSVDVLPALVPASYDIIYIDGSHTADDVLADAVLSWRLLKPSGVLIFDDWQFDPKLPDELRPTVAIDAFVTAYRRRLELVHRGYQVIVKKSAFGGCNAQPFCTPVGTHGYDFQQHQLVDADGVPVALAEAEKQLVERLVTSVRFGAARTEFDRADLERLGRPAIEALAPKLGLAIP